MLLQSFGITATKYATHGTLIWPSADHPQTAVREHKARKVATLIIVLAACSLLLSDSAGVPVVFGTYNTLLARRGTLAPYSHIDLIRGYGAPIGHLGLL